MSVDGDLACAITAAAVVADEVTVVVAAGLQADGVFELGYDRQRRKYPSTVWVRTDDAFGGDICDRACKTFEQARLLAETAFERQTSTVFKADGVGDLAFQGRDLSGLV